MAVVRLEGDVLAQLFLPGQHQAVVGSYSVAGGDGIVWYEPTYTTDVTWYR